MNKDKQKELYIKGHIRHGLRVGDKVKVISNIPKDRKGWLKYKNYGFFPVRDIVGKIVIINDNFCHRERGYDIYANGRHYQVPHYILRRVR